MEFTIPYVIGISGGTATWGQSFDTVTDVYLNMVRFRHEQYAESTKWTADTIINGSGNPELSVKMIARQVKNAVSAEL